MGLYISGRASWNCRRRMAEARGRNQEVTSKPEEEWVAGIGTISCPVHYYVHIGS